MSSLLVGAEAGSLSVTATRWPDGLTWDTLSAEQIEAIPALQRTASHYRGGPLTCQDSAFQASQDSYAKTSWQRFLCKVFFGTKEAMAMLRYEDLVRMRTAELRAEADEHRQAEQVVRVRRAERRFRRARSRLVQARLHVSCAS